MHTLRTAAVAGTFYPDQPEALRAAIAGHLGRADAAPPRAHPPKVLVVPHAGYVYSGDVAGLGYAELAPWRGHIRRVVLLGPVHRVPVRGLAASSADAFETPLGNVPVDTAALARLADLPQVVREDRAHAMEHSLEVQLPFLQAVLGDGWTLVPFAVGDATPDEVAQVIERLWGGDETVVVISSDLSHYLPYAQAQRRDQATVQRVLACATDLQGDEACGAVPLNGALQLARRKGLVPRLLGLRNSADAREGGAGRDRVVGYGAIAFDLRDDDSASGPGNASTEPGDAALGHALLAHARRAIAEALDLPMGAEPPAHPALSRPGATFVTLHDRHGDLRGCVGRLEASRPLIDDVQANAVAAAFNDSRFPPLRADEWPGLRVEVSLLDAAQPMSFASEADALAQLRPGVDGVILECGGARATFLPQVWEQLPDARGFMSALKRKAGLPVDFWSSGVRLSRYRVRKFVEAAR